MKEEDIRFIDVEAFKKEWGFYPIAGGEGDGGDGGDGGSGGDGGKVTIPSHTHTPGTAYALPEGVQFKDIVPGDYKDKPYMKDVKDIPSLFKKFDGAETLVGQRQSVIPGEGATDDDWNKFFDASGRPKTSDLYEFTTVKAADGTDVKRDPAFETAVKDIFHKAGISSKQAKAVQEPFDALIAKMATDQATTKDADFDKLASEAFGTDADKALDVGKKLLEEHMPKGYAEHFKNLPNESLILMAGVLKSVQAKYIKEDDIPGGGGGGGGSATSINELRKEGQMLMAKKEYQDSFHPDHKKVKAEVTDIHSF